MASSAPDCAAANASADKRCPNAVFVNVSERNVVAMAISAMMPPKMMTVGIAAMPLFRARRGRGLLIPLFTGDIARDLTVAAQGCHPYDLFIIQQ